MVADEVPQWLAPAWLRSCRGLGAAAPVEQIEAVGRRLIERWSRPERHFHNVRHLAEVLSRVDELAEEAANPDAVRVAAWYHGAVFDAAERAAYARRGGENEAASAELARLELTELGVPQPAVDRVHRLVTTLLRHQPEPGDFDCAVLCDADLSVLAAEPQRYQAYLTDVRAEYAHLPLEDYVQARLAILAKLLARPALFTSPLSATWEDAARENLTAELERLTKEAGKLRAQGPA